MMSLIEKESIMEKANAMDIDQKEIFLKKINTDLLYKELDRRIDVVKNKIERLETELNKLDDDSVLEDYERILIACEEILKEDV